MITVEFATRLRGFFKTLVTSNNLNFKIVSPVGQIYETNGRIHKLKSKLIRSKFADILGLIQRIQATPKTGTTILGSYNRFLKSPLPYFIYVENPTALYHYTLNRVNTRIGRKRIQALLKDPMLRGIIFMCKACQNTFEELVGEVRPEIVQKQIYPMVKPNPFVNLTSIGATPMSDTIKFLYIAQGIRFGSKGGYEIIEAFNRLANQYSNIHLTIVTNVEYIEQQTLTELRTNPNITLSDFKFSQVQMQELYSNSDVLLQPTSDDSCSLTILEALHSGMAFITSSLYSIPEIVTDGVNGFLVEPHYWFFSKDTNLPNPDVWNNRKLTLHSKVISNRLVKDLMNRMERLIINPDLLREMKLESWNRSNNPPFSEEFIAEQWNSTIKAISENNI